MSYCSAVKTVKARRRHFCEWCAGTIDRGVRYAQYTSFGDGGDVPFLVRLHLECLEAMDADPDPDDEPLIAGENNRGCYCADDPCICGSAERIAKAREAQS